MIKLVNRMKKEVKRNLNYYLDSARCFNATGLAEEFINQDKSHDEDSYFDAAVIVAEWAEKTYSLNV